LHDEQGHSGLYHINILRISSFLFYHFHFNRCRPNILISDNALIFGNHVFYSYHHYGHTYNFCVSHTASNIPILISPLKYSDFNNYIKPVLFIVLPSSVTSSSSSSSTSSITPSPTPTPGSGGHHFDANLFVTIIVPIIIAVITVITAVYVKRTRRLMNRYFCCLKCGEEGEEDHEHEREAHEMRNFPNSRI
jgi:hypothetical protein